MNDGPTQQMTPASMVLTDIVERHAQQAAFLWHLRDAAVRSPAYNLEALERLDDRVDANLDGLRIAGDVGWEICKAALAEAGGGEVFAAMVLAIEREDMHSLAQLLAQGLSSVDLARAIVSAIGWVPISKATRFLNELLGDNAPPQLHYFGIAGAAVHRHDPGVWLAHAAYADSVRLRARALRAIGELGRVDLLPELRRGLEAEDEGCRFWAAWSAALFGEPAAVDVLWHVACAGGVFAERACCMAMRFVKPALARLRVRELAAMDGHARIALAGSTSLGDASLVPWVLDCMSHAEHARFAGWVFTMVTGVDLRAQKLSESIPQGFRAGPTDDPKDLNVTPDRDASLPWPNVDAVKGWWARNGAGFPVEDRLLLGNRIEEDWLIQVLRDACQPAREAAAVDLAVISRGKPSFEVRAPGFLQRQRLSQTSR